MEPTSILEQRTLAAIPPIAPIHRAKWYEVIHSNRRARKFAENKARKGAKKPGVRRESEAVHEAGHAIACWHLGGTVLSVSMPIGDKPGITHHQQTGEEPLVHRNSLIIAFAGEAAEVVLLNRGWTLLSDADLAGAKEAASHLPATLSPGGDHFAAARQMAGCIVRQHAQKIRDLAALLLKRGSLTAAEFASFVEGQADG